MPANKLTDEEVSEVLDVLRSERFVDLSPAQVFHIFLDEGRYLASISTFYRLLRANGEVRERRRQATHPPRVRPELVARKPLLVWSWDITKLKGPKRGEYYDLYVVLDIFSRYVVAWLVAPCESGELAKELIADAMGLSSSLCKRLESWWSDVGVDAVGVDEGELLEGLFPVRGDLAFDETAGGSALSGG